MREIYYLLVRLRGGLRFAGGPDAPAGRRPDGLPFLPATALKGALREQAGRLLGPAVANHLFGSEGPGPGPRDQDAPAPPRSRWLFSDGELLGETARAAFAAGAGWDLRPQVAIDRRLRRAANQMLAMHEIVAPFGDLVFLSRCELHDLSAEERAALPGLVAAVFALGAGKSGGLGAVVCELRDEKNLLAEFGEQAALALARWQAPEVLLPEAEEIELIFEALEPLCLGGERPLGNFRPTLSYLPASALRGALATALAEALREEGGALGNDLAERLFLDPHTALRFRDGWPGEAGPPPLSTLVCKKHGADHGEIDGLLRSALLRRLEDEGHFVAPPLACKVCGSRLRAAGPPAARRRVISRVGIERSTAKAAEGQLFSLETLQPGSVFYSRVGALDAESRQLLGKALARGLRIGHGRGQGYGRLAARARPVAPLPLRARLERFDAEARSRFAALAAFSGTPEPGPGLLFTVTLESDLAPGGAAASAGLEEALLAALELPGEVRLLAGETRAGRRGGWDDLEGWHKTQRQVLLAGSTLLLHSGLGLAELLPTLAELERRGAGVGTAEGLGWVLFSSPRHLSEGSHG